MGACVCATAWSFVFIRGFIFFSRFSENEAGATDGGCGTMDSGSLALSRSTRTVAIPDVPKMGHARPGSGAVSSRGAPRITGEEGGWGDGLQLGGGPRDRCGVLSRGEGKSTQGQEQVLVRFHGFSR